MKIKLFSLLFSFISFIPFLQAQNSIKKVIVETYYISDSIDATDTIGGDLAIGSKTYRVYIQLSSGCSLIKIYGDNNHALKFSSTEPFFNNRDRGKTFAKDINKNSYYNNTAPLDSWLTIGQSTKSSANTYNGVLKKQDNDGSFIGGSNNDGGSAGIPDGLLTGSDPLISIPLTIADGMISMTNTPSNWSDNGFIDLITGVDSTIFGSVKIGKSFFSNNAYLQNSGVIGSNADSNQILVTQLTTLGDISFELNVEVREINGTITKYVASGNDTLDIKVSPWLKYPHSCGCKDPNYFEFSNQFAYNMQDSCKTRIVLGCMDPGACNYDANANYNIQELCCYPGLCADRDISLVCPNLGESNGKIKLFPNPAHQKINVELNVGDNTETKCIVYNSFGIVEVEKDLGTVSGLISQDFDISNLNPGIYFVHLITTNSITSSTFIKN